MTRTEPADEPPCPGPVAGPGRSRLWWALAALPFLPWLIGLAARWWWFAELFTHFRFQWLLGTGAIGLVLLFTRQWRPLALCGVAALILGGPMCGPIWRGGPPGLFVRKQVPRTIATANVLTSNRDAAAVIAALEDERPGVVCLQEVDARWNADLKPLYAERFADYEYTYFLPRPDNFGFAILSRFPMTIQAIDVEGLPMLRAVVDWSGTKIVVYNVHPPPPVGAAWAAQRNRYLAALAQRVAAETDRVLVCGDLNCTPWSPHFADLLETGKLDDPRSGARGPATWQAEHPLFALPIDHVLSRRGLWLEDLRAGPDVGSDHRPLFARVLVL